jgi:hypothetical protein
MCEALGSISGTAKKVLKNMCDKEIILNGTYIYSFT